MTNPVPPRRPPHHPMSDAELAALSEITPSDIARAKAAWENDAPAPFKKLLDATADEEPPPE